MFYPQPRGYNPEMYLLPPLKLIDPEHEWQRFMLSEEIEDIKQEAIYAYKSQLRDPVVRPLLLSSIRKNEIFSIRQVP
jgi:LmbE family N-acetylglucosaminyl deacetylase